MPPFTDPGSLPSPSGRLKCVWVRGADGRLESVWVPDCEQDLDAASAALDAVEPAGKAS